MNKYESSVGISILKFRQNIAKYLDILFIIPRWEERKKLHLLRLYLFLPILSMPTIAIVLKWIANQHNETIDQLLVGHFILFHIIEFLAQSYIGMKTNGYIFMILSFLAFLRTHDHFKQGTRTWS
ncbi:MULTISPECIES: hypothetical protein [unclassified Paenibacillus]|uniref:hypothetical protein n=1 Tax=unclassified Paenibacillus TaxID=185978 RepID=UPI0027807304|nr:MULTISPECIES: hypothetical protein [unclassified Paenibacillus]MDQ0896333.1 hypothetical protein [Paenibacillus sp. V4I7]MDQ0914122.1 hypothetical protein [Paenibacillus sp. V4I5]